MTKRMMRRPWVILALLGFTIVFAAFVYDAQRESTAIRLLRQADIPLSVEELQAKYSPEPWEQNGARLYLQAMKKHKAPERSSWEHLVITGDLEHEYGHVFTGEQRDALRAYVAANAETIALLLKAQECPFTRLPGSRYDIYGNKTLSRSRDDLARLVACAALDAALSGDVETMGGMIAAGLRLHEIMDEGGMIIDALVAKSICTIAFDALEDCLYYARPSSEVVHSWLSILDTEMYTTLRGLGEIFKNETTFHYQMYAYEGPYFEWPRRLQWQRTLLKLALEGTQLRYFVQNGYILGMKSHITMAGNDSCDFNTPPEDILLEERWDGNMRNTYYAYGAFLVGRVLTIYAYNMAHAATVRAALGSLLYLEDQGKIPDTLEVLTPHYLPHPAHDPFTRNELLRCRVDNGQAVFYSVGSNKKDEGGREAEYNQSIYDHGDILFRLRIGENKAGN